MAADVLSGRALGRATLARQLLLRRSEAPVLDTVAHLVGMQAQVPTDPYLGLWSRLTRFRPDALSRLLLNRRVVRIVVMRGTIHLVTADDCLVLRPLVQPVLDQELARHADYAPALRGLDLGPVLAYGRSVLDERPRTGPQLRAAMKERFPDLDPGALAYACRNHLALVQVPPRGVWGESAQVTTTTAEAWLGRPVATEPSIDDVVLRYFGAFGPATVADVSTWCRLAGLREVVDRLRPHLRPFRDERGRELFDIPDAPRPDPATPAPPRFLPEYDNVLLSHADRSRFVGVDDRKPLWTGPQRGRGTVLAGGTVAGTWGIVRGPGDTTLDVRTLRPLSDRDATAVEAEAHRVVRFLAPGAGQVDVRVRPAG